MMRHAACKEANPLKIRASLGHAVLSMWNNHIKSQSLKDQGKSRTDNIGRYCGVGSQSLKDQGKSRTSWTGAKIPTGVAIP